MREGYVIANIEGKEEQIKAIVKQYYDSLEYKDEVSVQSAVDFVMNNLPTGVERVDGYVIEPLLNQVKSEEIVVVED
jgi:hypothetical protein